MSVFFVGNMATSYFQAIGPAPNAVPMGQPLSQGSSPDGAGSSDGGGSSYINVGAPSLPTTENNFSRVLSAAERYADLFCQDPRAEYLVYATQGYEKALVMSERRPLKESEGQRLHSVGEKIAQITQQGYPSFFEAFNQCAYLEKIKSPVDLQALLERAKPLVACLKFHPNKNLKNRVLPTVHRQVKAAFVGVFLESVRQAQSVNDNSRFRQVNLDIEKVARLFLVFAIPEEPLFDQALVKLYENITGGRLRPGFQFDDVSESEPVVALQSLLDSGSSMDPLQESYVAGFWKFDTERIKIDVARRSWLGLRDAAEKAVDQAGSVPFEQVERAIEAAQFCIQSIPEFHPEFGKVGVLKWYALAHAKAAAYFARQGDFAQRDFHRRQTSQYDFALSFFRPSKDGKDSKITKPTPKKFEAPEDFMYLDSEEALKELQRIKAKYEGALAEALTLAKGEDFKEVWKFYFSEELAVSRQSMNSEDFLNHCQIVKSDLPQKIEMALAEAEVSIGELEFLQRRIDIEGPDPTKKAIQEFLEPNGKKNWSRQIDRVRNGFLVRRKALLKRMEKSIMV